MRMRKRHNLGPRMERCADLLVDEPGELRGRWLAAFPERKALYVELGCGKGRFTAGTAGSLPDALLVAIEKVPDAMIVAMERVRDAALPNVRFLDTDAERLPEIFAPGEIHRGRRSRPFPTQRLPRPPEGPAGARLRSGPRSLAPER